MRRTDGGGFGNLCVLEGVEVVLDVNDGRFLDRNSEERIWLHGLGGFWLRGLIGSRRAVRSGRRNALRPRVSVEIQGGYAREHTGVKTIAWGLGLNDDAFTFNRLTAAEVFPSPGGELEGLPLKGGMAWINKPDRLVGASDLASGFVAAG